MREPLAEGPEEIETLIALMARLPGLGPRSARRAVLHLIRKRGQMLLPLAAAMQAAGEAVRECVTCGNLATSDLCPVCADTRRGNGLICVVADVADLWAMERSGAFKGRYHVLGGLLSALGEMGPDELGIPRLKARLEAEAVSEVILALPATIDGQTTAHYLADTLAGLSVTSLAQGVPVGGELDFLDEGTISAALRARGAV